MTQTVKNLPAVQATLVQSLGQKDLLEKGIGTHSSILAWRIPWTEEPGRLQSMGSQRIGHDWSTNTCTSLSKCKKSFFSTYSKTDSSWIWSVGHNFPTFAFNNVNIEQRRRVKKIGQNNLSPNLACYKIFYQEFILKNRRKHIYLPNFF